MRARVADLGGGLCTRARETVAGPLGAPLPPARHQPCLFPADAVATTRAPRPHAGHALSQTGGHGDFRGRGEECCACGAALRGIGRVCDGVAECRRAARDELRRGAHCVKVMASGGVSSPTDRLESPQFSLEELRAIVEEAEAAGTYV